MPTPLPQGQHIVVSHIRIEHPYHMDSMQMATDHYNIGITLQGHRRTITPTYAFSYKAGDVALLPPFILHRTLSEYNEPYERIMIKFSPEFVEPFIRNVGQHIFNKIYENFVYHFTADIQEKLKKMFHDILTEYQKDTPYKEFILQGMLFRLFTTILEEHIPVKPDKTPSLFLTRLLMLLYIWKNIIKSNLHSRKWQNMQVFQPDTFRAFFMHSLV